MSTERKFTDIFQADTPQSIENGAFQKNQFSITLMRPSKKTEPKPCFYMLFIFN